MTKWLLCGCGPFSPSRLFPAGAKIILFIHFYCQLYKHTPDAATNVDRRSFHKSPGFMDNLFLFMCRQKQFFCDPFEERASKLTFPSTAETCVKLNMSAYHLPNLFFLNFHESLLFFAMEFVMSVMLSIARKLLLLAASYRCYETFEQCPTNLGKSLINFWNGFRNVDVTGNKKHLQLLQRRRKMK